METNHYQNCKLCPRLCSVNRFNGERGFCGEGAALRIAAACLHKGEEPPLCGDEGSGAIFVSGCGLRCAFCQNWQISHNGMGAEVSTETFAGICLELQKKKAANINIVTASHVIPSIIQGIALAKKSGLCIPVLWNSGGYETEAAVDMLRDTVDVYLPDLKTLDSGVSNIFFKAPDYPEMAKAAIKKMAAQKPLRFAKNGSLTSGVVIRHLILPGFEEETNAVLEWFAANVNGRALFSLMTQYTPINGLQPASSPRSFLSPGEYKTALRRMEALGIEDGYYQELESSSNWLPDFSRPEPFPGELAKCVWHWKYGFSCSG
ncbi:MAG: radical SAM protein [Spirochaetaceae bacterium]|jgi:putative pyruvate formate lyase activating enzyme|nr:radical SAM protein [Spirochaetaceae bacterium]